MRTNCTAFAKLVANKKLNTVRLLVTFDATKRNKHGEIIITSKNAAYASGDLIKEQDVTNAVTQAKAALRVFKLTFV